MEFVKNHRMALTKQRHQSYLANNIILLMDEIILTHPINSAELLWFLFRGFDDPVYSIKNSSVLRAFKIDDEKVLVKITPGNLSVQIEWLCGNRSEEKVPIIKDFIDEWFDLECNIMPFYELLKTDDRLCYMVDDFSGLKLIGMPDLFEALVWAIIGQQINLTFAYKIKRRLIEKYGDFIDYDDHRYYMFPSPQVIAAANPDDLKIMQLSTGKIAYLKNAATVFAEGKINKAVLKALPDPIARRNLLISQKGIGIWTANYVLMKSLRDQTAVPFGDAGLLNALLNHGIIKTKADQAEMHTLFEKFSGWEAYLVFYLWRSLAPMPGVR